MPLQKSEKSAFLLVFRREMITFAAIYHNNNQDYGHSEKSFRLEASENQGY
jgi:hypothetical protein